MDEDLQSVSSGSIRSPSYSISDLSETEGFVVQELTTSASRSFGGSSNLLEHNGEDESNFRVGGLQNQSSFSMRCLSKLDSQCLRTVLSLRASMSQPNDYCLREVTRSRII